MVVPNNGLPPVESVPSADESPAASGPLEMSTRIRLPSRIDESPAGRTALTAPRRSDDAVVSRAPVGPGSLEARLWRLLEEIAGGSLPAWAIDRSSGEPKERVVMRLLLEYMAERGIPFDRLERLLMFRSPHDAVVPNFGQSAGIRYGR